MIRAHMIYFEHLGQILNLPPPYIFSNFDSIVPNFIAIVESPSIWRWPWMNAACKLISPFPIHVRCLSETVKVTFGSFTAPLRTTPGDLLRSIFHSLGTGPVSTKWNRLIILQNANVRFQEVRINQKLPGKLLSRNKKRIVTGKISKYLIHLRCLVFMSLITQRIWKTIRGIVTGKPNSSQNPSRCM